MQIPVAYIAVVLIWSTTPLAIQWSNTSLTPSMALTSRMFCAWLIVTIMGLMVSRHKLDVRENWKSYAAGSLGIYPNMYLVYLAAQYIPSGLISVLFGLSAFGNALLAGMILGEKVMSPSRYLALVLALVGLTIVSYAQLSLGENALLGVILMLFSVTLHSLSSVLTKYFGAAINGVKQMQGSLLFSLPGLFITLFITGLEQPVELESRSVMAVAYLTIIATVIGFSLFYFLLQSVSAVSLGLIALVTPVLAVWFGNVFNDEVISVSLIAGSLLIILGLGLFNLAMVKVWLAEKKVER